MKRDTALDVLGTLMPTPLDLIALEAARSIEDEFAKGHAGGVTQRQASVQVIIATAIQKAFDVATKGMLNSQSKSEER